MPSYRPSSEMQRLRLHPASRHLPKPKRRSLCGSYKWLFMSFRTKMIKRCPLDAPVDSRGPCIIDVHDVLDVLAVLDVFDRMPPPWVPAG